MFSLHTIVRILWSQDRWLIDLWIICFICRAHKWHVNNFRFSVLSADVLCVSSKIFVPVNCDFRFDFVGDYFCLHLRFIGLFLCLIHYFFSVFSTCLWLDGLICAFDRNILNHFKSDWTWIILCWRWLLWIWNQGQ